MTIETAKQRGAKNFNEVYAPSMGLTTLAIPENNKPVLAVYSQTGVSTRNVLQLKPLERQMKHWYALRTTYGREKKAYEYIIANQGTAYYPTIFVDKLINGRIKTVEVSRIPNIFFAYGTEAEIKHFVYDNLHLPFLRFYYHYFK